MILSIQLCSGDELMDVMWALCVVSYLGGGMVVCALLVGCFHSN